MLWILLSALCLAPTKMIVRGANLGTPPEATGSEAMETPGEMVRWISRTRSVIRAHLDENGRRRFDQEFYPERTLKASRNGTSNVFVVAPHGYPGDDDHTDYLAYFLSIELRANYLINNKAFYKPVRTRAMGEAANLNRPWSTNPHTRQFMEKLLEITKETRDRSGATPFVIAVHGMSDANARAYGAGDFCIGAGYTSEERETAFRTSGSATASREVVEGLLRVLRGGGFVATDGVPQYSAKRAIPSFLKQREGEIGAVQAIQVEIRYHGFRDPASVVETARTLGTMIRSLPAFNGSR
jgi:hypothetical protein